MEFVPATCPNCAGKLQLPNDRASVQCMYCGNTIAVKQAIQQSGVNTANFFKLAKKAAEAGNSREAYDYYTKILEHEPDNGHAWFGKAEAAGWVSTLADFRVSEMVTGFEHAVELCEANEKATMARRANESLNSVSSAFYSLAKQHLVEYVALDNSWTDYLGQCQLIMLGLEKAHEFDPSDKVTLENIITLCSDNIQGVKYNDPYDNNASKVWFLSDAYENEMRQKMNRYVVIMQKLDPSYTPPNPQRQKPNACFVATATMGDYDHPLVKDLRVFRDQVLATSDIGQWAIDKYYRFGPHLARVIERSPMRQHISRVVLINPLAQATKVIIATRNSK